MSTGLFDSVKGSMIHYFIRPNDDFVLNSLEKLDADEYLYRLLREDGFEQIFFINIGVTNCSVWTYDKFSYWVTKEDLLAESIDMLDPNSVSSFLKQVEGKDKPTLNLKLKSSDSTKQSKSEIPTAGKTLFQKIGSAKEFQSFMQTKIYPALISDNIKSAVVIPLELFEKRETEPSEWRAHLADSVISTIREAQKLNSAKRNMIVLTTSRKHNIINCLDYPTSRDLHYWAQEVLASLSYDKNRADAALMLLRDYGMLVLADKICDDEIANLLFRKKLIEKAPGFEKIPVSKIYPLAEYLGEHARQENVRFKSIDSFRFDDYIRQLNEILKRKEVLEELIVLCSQLKPRVPKSIENLKSTNLQRITGHFAERYEISDEERTFEFNQAMTELNTMIGLGNVKKKLTQRLSAIKAYKENKGPGHYIFTGNPGTGKTEVARLVGRIFKAMGLLKKGHVVECRGADLVSNHVGESAIQTRKKCEEALDGVLFVDEAYVLVNTAPSESPFPSKFEEDAYTEILAFMENNRDRICVIFAGYDDKMRYFREANAGMESRIGKRNVIAFPDYNVDELFQIFSLFAQKNQPGFTISPEFETAIREVIEDMVSLKTETFGNARQMRELFESCKDCAADRYVTSIDDDSKYLLTAADIPDDMRYSVSKSGAAVAMQALRNLVGLDSVKEKLERQLNVVRAYGTKKGPGHYIFTGNPGTGKTEVARLMGQIFKAMGLLKKGHVVECKKADLVAGHVGQTSQKTRAKCKEALDGVLFVDEAYDLVNTGTDGQKFKSSFDEAAYTELLTFMENNRRRVCVIFAGYPNEMRMFRNANPGMPGRIGENNIIHFPDYNADELFLIFDCFAKMDDVPFTLSDDFSKEIRKVIEKMVKSKTDTFSNAREMRVLFDRCKECAAQRTVQTENDSSKYTLTLEDIPGEFYPRASQAEFEGAMASLNEMIGLADVKETLSAILDTKLIYEEERIAGHYVFSGNPGTGKTEVARKLGAIFKAMGMLRSGHVVECRKADLVAGAVGQTAIKTRQKCEEALDGILFVDEAYELVNTEPTGNKFSSTFDEEAYTEIMAFMENNRHRVCVIFAGYANLMEKFLDANDGMRSRVTKVVHFPDYSADELVQILALMAKKEGFTFAPDFEDAAREAIAVRKKECAGKFANAREVRELFNKFKQNVAVRMKQLHFEGRLEEMNAQKHILTAEDALVGSMKEEREDISVAMADLTELIGLVAVKRQVRSIANKVRYPADPSKGIVPGHYIFAGNPGTGKTEVARLMARIFKSIGVLTKSSVVEVTRNDLVAGYVGQTAIKTMDRCKEALGGVLFVDEAYTLFSGNSEHDFGKEALDTIMKFMEDNRDRVCVIFAGYEEPMMKLMEVNDGFDSRITEIIRFPDYSAEELIDIMHFMAAKQNLELADDFVEKASKLLTYRVATKTKTFGNAREVRKMLNAADGNRANRIAEAVENGEDPNAIQMNLLVASDLGLGKRAASDTQNSNGNASAYQRVEGAPIKGLAPLYGEEVFNNRIKLGAATDSAVLFVRTDAGYGTAFLISPDGYALTCNHVISGANKIEARFRMPGRAGGSDSWHNCKVINTKVDLDIALIKLDGENFPYLSLAPEGRVIQKGEDFILSGYPLGKRTAKDLTTFHGYVASTEKQTDDNGFARYNINCEAKSGNSGAPIIALADGRVIGILLGSMTERTSETLTEEINYMRPVQYFWEEFVN